MRSSRAVSPDEQTPHPLTDRLRQSPLGLAFDEGSPIPRLIEGAADIVERRSACVLEQAHTLLAGLGLVGERAPLLRPVVVPPPTPPSVSAADVEIEEAVQSDSMPAAPQPPVDSLAIPSYDSLSASQVVPRLASLQSEELEEIAAYEMAGRARRTILNRIEQLRGA